MVLSAISTSDRIAKNNAICRAWRLRIGRKTWSGSQVLHPSAELREQIRLFRHLKSNPPRRNASSSVPADNNSAPSSWPSQFRSAPAVFVLILVNVLVFLYEIFFGNWNDPGVLHRIGALEPNAVVAQSEYWRLFTALFLHAGFLHLAFNLFALYVLGPPLERSIGTIRFLACYLISGLASGAGVVALNRMGLMPDAQVVGASGCILGVVGAWAGFLLRHHHVPLAKQQLANIGFIIVIQIAFDLSTPEVSMSSHMFGLVAGFLLWAGSRAKSCSQEALTPAEATSCPTLKSSRAGMTATCRMRFS